LAAPLAFDGTVVAATGTLARLLVTDKVKRADGSSAIEIALGDFRLKQGELPVTPLMRIVSTIVPGTVIPATTQGSVERAGDRIVIRVPVPMALSTAAPAAAYTAYPAVTPAPIIPGARRGSTPTPLPTTFNPPEPVESPATLSTPGAPVSAAPSP
jgi:hypothetical protein